MLYSITYLTNHDDMSLDHSMYIETVSFKRQGFAKPIKTSIWAVLEDKSVLDFCPRPAKKKKRMYHYIREAKILLS